MSSIIFLMFFLSGATALVYEVVWVRALSLVFGGSHFAVTSVLSVYMGGLALGGYIIGKRVDTLRKPLRLYGFLEIGIAVFAAIFVLLMKLYPAIYVPLSQAVGGNIVSLSVVRVLFSVVAMIVPTTLMGGTLPVLSRFVTGDPQHFGKQLSFLYGINTLGAVAGAMAAGFYLLRHYSVRMTLSMAILTNLAIGAACVLLQRKVSASGVVEEAFSESMPAAFGEGTAPVAKDEAGGGFSAYRLVLWGIAISGFCALGYEVLWTRILSMVIGASVYGFTIMLVAFLSGIALGGGAFGLLGEKVSTPAAKTKESVLLFGALQILIGTAALAVTFLLRDLPAHAIRMQNLILSTGASEFEVRQGANIIVAFSYMFVPAFFMGLAFPLAGAIYREHRRKVGSSVGEILAYNTMGAILGAALSGFALIHLFGIERSLQLLMVINIGAGIFIAFSTLGNRILNLGIAAAVAAFTVVLVANPGWFRMWDRKYFAIYRNNQREAFNTPFNMKDALENTEVLYYGEGVEANVSSIQVKGGHQAFITNGRVEASNHREGMQCQYVLGHLPMLLSRNPKKVFVLGLGSGMTLGATSVHPGVEEIVLAEIEPKVFGVARTFARYNHNVLDNPKLRVIQNDGRNYLLTTKEKFDVITADPIHPWFSGAGYLYTSEYFRLASERLRPGGIVCQWLPIYELTPDDLKSVVKTFTKNFRYALLWLTRNDAELVGSNEPILIDEADLERRIAAPGVAEDLEGVDMGSADDLLSYFVAGTEKLKAFGARGVVNTDDNLHLEFSAPLSIGVPLMGVNASVLYQHRESLLPYLLPAIGDTARALQIAKWDRYLQAGRRCAGAHVLFLGGGFETLEYRKIMEELDLTYPGYAPARLLKREVQEQLALVPTLLRSESFALLNERGEQFFVEISAVKAPVSGERAAVVFADNRTKTIFGQRYFSGERVDEELRGFTEDVLGNLRDVYRRELDIARAQGKPFPSAAVTLEKMKGVIFRKSQGKGF